MNMYILKSMTTSKRLLNRADRTDMIWGWASLVVICLTVSTAGRPVTKCFEKMDLVIILEVSTYKTQQNYYNMLNYTTYFLRQSDVDGGSVRVGVLAYSGEIKILFNLNTYSTQREVIDAIERVPYIYDEKNKNRTGSIQVMRQTMFTSGNGDRSNIENVCMVISDNFEDGNFKDTLDQGSKALQSGIKMYGIGYNMDVLRKTFAALLNGVVSLHNYDELPDLADSVFVRNCTDNDQCTPNPCPDGASCTSTEGNYTCLCTAGYLYNGSHCVMETSRLGTSIQWPFVLGSSVGVVVVVVVVVTSILVKKRKVMTSCSRPGLVPAGQEPSGQMSAGQVDAGRPPGPSYMYSSDSLPGTPVVRQSKINMSDEYAD